MSLINDALKRAQETQKKSPPPLAGAPLHSVPTERRSAMPLIAGAVILLLLGVGAGVLLQLNKREPATKIAVAPAQPAVQNSEPQKNVQPAPPVAVPVANIPVAAQPVISPAPTPVTPSVAAEPSPKPPVSEIEVASTKPAWPKLKLQGIIYVPRKPSVVINGKALFVGERVDGAQVVAISPESVTLVFTGRTNVLSVP